MRCVICQQKKAKRTCLEYPDYHTVHYGLGVCALVENDYETAVSHFRKAALTLDPHYMPAISNKKLVEKNAVEGEPADFGCREEDFYRDFR